MGDASLFLTDVQGPSRTDSGHHFVILCVSPEQFQQGSWERLTTHCSCICNINLIYYDHFYLLHMSRGQGKVQTSSSLDKTQPYSNVEHSQEVGKGQEWRGKDDRRLATIGAVHPVSMLGDKTVFRPDLRCQFDFLSFFL